MVTGEGCLYRRGPRNSVATTSDFNATQWLAVLIVESQCIAQSTILVIINHAAAGLIPKHGGACCARPHLSSAVRAVNAKQTKPPKAIAWTRCEMQAPAIAESAAYCAPLVH